MKNYKIVLIHILCWSLIFAYVYGGYLLKRASFSSTAFGISITLVQLIEFYICYLWVFPRFLKRGKIISLILALIVAMAAFILSRYVIEEVLYEEWFGFSNYSSSTTIFEYAIDNIYYGTSYIVVAAAIYGALYSLKSEKMNNKLKEEAIKAELSFLKSQINPHFLYNTLNYIYSLAIPVSDQLANAVLRLSDLMRYTLAESSNGKVQLNKEIDYIESYIALFKMRFDPLFFVVFKQEVDQDNNQIAALMLIPFVENAFKHGLINNPTHPIKINLKCKNKRLTFEVSNQINRAQKDHSSGVGLVNIHRRLELIYPDQHELLISNNGNTYKSTLIINL